MWPLFFAVLLPVLGFVLFSVVFFSCVPSSLESKPSSKPNTLIVRLEPRLKATIITPPSGLLAPWQIPSQPQAQPQGQKLRDTCPQPGLSRHRKVNLNKDQENRMRARSLQMWIPGLL